MPGHARTPLARTRIEQVTLAERNGSREDGRSCADHRPYRFDIESRSQTAQRSLRRLRAVLQRRRTAIASLLIV
jgi:hypothetical protein